jgi:hypothetical protein
MKETKKGVDYSKATPDLVERVKGVIANNAIHRYSVSEIYPAYNAAFGLSERPQTCSSCLRFRAKRLAEWLKGYEEYLKNKASKAKTDSGNTQGSPKLEKPKEGQGNGQIVDVNDERYKAPAIGVIRIPMRECTPIDLMPIGKDDQTRGKVRYADGTAVPPGKYITARGETVVVQIGGKGRIDVEDLT